MAKSFKISRKELNQPDQFISTTDTILTYFSRHKNRFIYLFTGLIVIIFSVFIINHNKSKNSLLMESLYYEMEKISFSEGGNTTEKISQMKEKLKEFNQSAQKQRATLMVADKYFNIGEYDQALELYKIIESESSKNTLSRKIAMIGIAYSLEGKNDYKDAIIVYQKIIRNFNDYPLFDIYLGIVRCHVLSDEKPSALLILREMKVKFASHPKLMLVDEKIKKLDVLN
jgi:tetratricopeptide (TPR) repeat protein